MNTSGQPTLDVELLWAAYADIDARDIDVALALMTADVTWPKAFKGGFVRGPEEICAYWTEQWREISPHVSLLRFTRRARGKSWLTCIKSCAAWLEPCLRMSTWAIDSPSSKA